MIIEYAPYDVILIRPWGLQFINLGGWHDWIKSADLPVWFGPVMWTYLGLCMLGLLFSMFVREKPVKIIRIKTSLSQFLIGLVGLSYIAVGVIAIVFTSIRLSAFFGGVPLQGKIAVDVNPELLAHVFTGLKYGYYLIYVAGIMLVVLAILRNKLLGLKKD